MYSYTSARPFNAVTNNVIAVGAHSSRVGVDKPYIRSLWARERMMSSIPALLIFVPKHQRKVQDPRERQFSRIRKIEASCNLISQARQNIASSLITVGDKQKQV